jgi:UrcA family protein
MSFQNCGYRIISSALAATLFTLGSFGASAADLAKADPASFTFRFVRGELSSPAGADRAYNQLVRDARRACREIGPGRELWRARLRRECEADLIDKVVAKVAAPQLVARHQGTGYFRVARR